MIPGILASVAIGPAAAIVNDSFDDPVDEATFEVDMPGTLYWAITETDVNPTHKQIADGGGGVLERGNILVPYGNYYDANYTPTSGPHLSTRRLHYYINPLALNNPNSNIIRTDIVLNFAPAAFEISEWYLLDSEFGETIDIVIDVLPFNNGFAITELEYRINGGTWTELPGATRGIYEVGGLTNGVEYDIEIRAINIHGPSLTSDVKSATPSDVGGLWDDTLVARWEATEGLTLDGSSVLFWEDQVGGMTFYPDVGATTLLPTDSPNGGPVLRIDNGASFNSEDFVSTSDIPLGGADRTVVVLFRLFSGIGNFTSVPMYGAPNTETAFGISVGSDELPRADYWENSIVGTTNFSDADYHMVSTRLKDQRARLYVDGDLENFSIILELNTADGIIKIGRSLDNLSRSGVDVAAILIFNSSLHRMHIQEAEQYLIDNHVV
jgi:hypothetical protein